MRERFALYDRRARVLEIHDATPVSIAMIRMNPNVFISCDIDLMASYKRIHVSALRETKVSVYR